MNRWEIVFSGALVLTLFSVCLERGECSSNIRQRSDGCGPHPLIALAAASRPFGSNGVGSLNDVLRAVRADPVVWPVMQNLLRRYDDCIRAADGLHYKRSDNSRVGGGDAPSSTTTASLSSSFDGGVAARPKNSALRAGGGGDGGDAGTSGTARGIFINAGFPVPVDSQDATNVASDIIIPWLPSSI